MLRIIQTIRNSGIAVVENWAHQKKLFSQSSNCLKKYKYALDPKKQKNKSAGSGFYRSVRESVLSEGKALTFFSFDDEYTDQAEDRYSRKQSAYSEVVHGAVEILLSSKEVDKEVQRCCVEITKVQVSPTLATANVYWQLHGEGDHIYTKEETEAVFSKNLPQLRLLLPAYTTITLTPSIHFTFDDSVEKQKEIDSLFDSIRKAEEDFLQRNNQDMKYQLQENI